MQNITNIVYTLYDQLYISIIEPILEYAHLISSEQTTQNKSIYQTIMSSNFQTVKEVDSVIKPEELEKLSDIMTGQDPIQCCPENFESSIDPIIKSLMGKLKNFWTQLQNPLDDRILEIISEISAIIGDTRQDFLTKYITLIEVCGKDVNVIIDELIIFTKEGPTTIRAMIRAAIVAYSIASAKQINPAIEQISTITADLTVINNNSQSQQTFQKESLEHFTIGWNALASSVTKLMGEVDKKILALHQPGPSHKTYTGTPSLDSRDHKEESIGSKLTFNEGYEYKNKYGTLRYITERNYTFMAENENGVLLNKLIITIKALKPLIAVLNKDLEVICKRLHDTKAELENYPNMNKDEKFEYLKRLISGVETKSNQWIAKPIF